MYFIYAEVIEPPVPSIAGAGTIMPDGVVFVEFGYAVIGVVLYGIQKESGSMPFDALTRGC